MNTEKPHDPLGRKAGEVFLRTLKEMPKPPDDTDTNIALLQSALRMAAAQTATLERIGRNR